MRPGHLRVVVLSGDESKLITSSRLQLGHLLHRQEHQLILNTFTPILGRKAWVEATGARIERKAREILFGLDGGTLLKNVALFQ